MAAADWDRTQGPSFVTDDDSDNDNIFGEDALLMPAASSGHIFYKTTEVNQTDMHVEFDFYAQSGESLIGFDLVCGTRIDDTVGVTHGDGYYSGIQRIGGSQYLVIQKRVSGVITVLVQGALLSLAVSTLYKFIVENKGDLLSVMLMQGAVPISGCNTNDSTFSGAGTAGVGRFLGAAASRMYMDNYEVTNTA